MPAIEDALIEEGLTFQRRGALADAIKRYRLVLQTEPARPDALYYLASAHCAQGQFGQGVELARQAIAADSGDARAHNLLGRALNRIGRNEDALASFAEALRLAPDFAEAYGNRGNVLSELGRLPEAVADYQRATALRPDSVEDLCNCGAALEQMGRHAEALTCFERAVALRPDFAPARFNRATALVNLGRYQEALADFDSVLAMAPGAVEAWNNRGSVLKKLGRDQDALASFDRALSIKPDSVEALNNRGTTLNKLKRHDEALAVYERVIALDPQNVDVRLNLANALAALKRQKEAAERYREVIARNPTHVDAHMGAGRALQALQRYAEAFEMYERVMALAPEMVDAHDNAGVVLYELGRYEEALACGRKVIELKPDLASGHYNVGVALAAIERQDEAFTHYDRALALSPDDATASMNKGMLCLNLGRFAEGWPLYERRFDVAESKLTRKHPEVLAWSGEYVDGTLLAWCEQGLGDEILAASMVPDLTTRARSVVLQPSPRLVKLFARSFPDVRVSAEPPPHIAAQVPFGSLGRYLRPGWEAFPRRERGYLTPQADTVERFRARLADGGRPVVGLSWRSVNPTIGRDKSAPLRDFAPILRIPGARFIDLQYGDTSAERHVVERELGVRIERLDDVDTTNDIDGLAALIAACDLVVTVSNTTAHLAGAVGAPTLVFVPSGPARLWYWFKAKEQSPWYPRVHVRHQAVGQSWRDLIARSEAQAAGLLASGVSRR